MHPCISDTVPFLGAGHCALTLSSNLYITGVSQIDRVVEAVEETLKGNTVQLLAKKALPKLDLPKVLNGNDTCSLTLGQVTC